MARAGSLLCGALLCVSCADNPYVIGRYPAAAAADAASDAAADAGSDECTGVHAAALVCSGFESEELEAEWPDTSVSTTASLQRSTQRAHSGSASLHATSAAAESLAVISREFPPLTTGELYLRAYVYVPADLMTETMNLFFLGEEPSPIPPEPFLGIDFNLEHGAAQLYSPQWTPPRTTGSLLIPRDRWFCFRAHVQIGDADGAVSVFIDDQLAVESREVDTLPPGGIGRLRAGIDWSSAQDAFFEVFIDDLVLDTTEPSCE